MKFDVNQTVECNGYRWSVVSMNPFTKYYKLRRIDNDLVINIEVAEWDIERIQNVA